MSVSVMHDDPEMAAVVRIQGARLQLLSVLADLASDPLDVQRAQAMREALDETEEIRPLLAALRQESRGRRHLSVVPDPVEEDPK